MNLTYYIQESEFSQPGPFRVNASTGELGTTKDLDYETRTSYTFMVVCIQSLLQGQQLFKPLLMWKSLFNQSMNFDLL